MRFVKTAAAEQRRQGKQAPDAARREIEKNADVGMHQRNASSTAHAAIWHAGDAGSQSSNFVVGGPSRTAAARHGLDERASASS